MAENLHLVGGLGGWVGHTGSADIPAQRKSGQPAGWPTVQFIPVTPPTNDPRPPHTKNTSYVQNSREQALSQRLGLGLGWFGGPHTRRCIHKVVHTQGGAHTRRSVATARVLLFKGGAGLAPASSEASRLSSEAS